MTISKRESVLTSVTTPPGIERLTVAKPNFTSIWWFQAVQYEVSSLLLRSSIENKVLGPLRETLTTLRVSHVSFFANLWFIYHSFFFLMEKKHLMIDQKKYSMILHLDGNLTKYLSKHHSMTLCVFPHILRFENFWLYVFEQVLFWNI